MARKKKKWRPVYRAGRRSRPFGLPGTLPHRGTPLGWHGLIAMEGKSIIDAMKKKKCKKKKKK